VGHAYILEKIAQENAVFGGELSGHLFFPVDYYHYDDGIYAGLKIAEIVSEIGSLADYVDELPVGFSTPEFLIPAKDEEKFKIIDDIKNYLKENNFDFLGIDGARINHDDGWALVRASNTSPHIKGRVEGDTKEAMERIKKELFEILEKAGLDVSKIKMY